MFLHDNKDLTQATATRSDGAAIARFILDAATAWGIKIGTDGDELVTLVPVQVPYETQKWFAAKLDEFRAEVIAIIQRENAGGAA